MNEAIVSARRGKSVCGVVEIALVLAWVLLIPIAAASAGRTGPGASERRPAVVLDPGHGGADSGARGPSGILEKDVCLRFARELERVLSARHSVSITRDGDRDVDLFRRTSAANAAGADAFVSIHAGSGFDPYPAGIVVFYFENKAAAGGNSEADDAWDAIQERHSERSRELAERIVEETGKAFPETEARARGAGILVLEGADMPAAMVEIGKLANPLEEKALSDPRYLQRLAGAVGSALEDFLRRNP